MLNMESPPNWLRMQAVSLLQDGFMKVNIP